MIIPFSTPNVFHPDASRAENAESLAAYLECLIEQNRVARRYRSLPLLYASGVVYGRTLEWENIPAVMRRGYGDCKSLAAWLVSDYRHVKKQPARAVFRWFNRPDGSGARDFHIVIATKTGFEDPSRKLGMGRDALY